MAGVKGLEPSTSAVTGQRSNQLSYDRSSSNYIKICSGKSIYTLSQKGNILRCVEGGLRSRDLRVMSAVLLPAELPRQTIHYEIQSEKWQQDTTKCVPYQLYFEAAKTASALAISSG